MQENKKILLTGASGFIGGALLDSFTTEGCVVLGRNCPKGFKGEFFRKNLDFNSDYSEALENISTVIHCAARTHVMNDDAIDPLLEFRKLNLDATINLATQAAESGVDRFIFISSIKVNGESTTGTNKFNELDLTFPQDPYAQSKMEAEVALRLLSVKTGLEVVIIRPPLVYGPGVKANFHSLLKLSGTWLPLPFSLVNNKRSMIYVSNLVDFIKRCIEHPLAANEIFLVSDCEDISLSSLLQKIRLTVGRRSLLFPVPIFVFILIGRLLGKIDLVDRLVGDLQLDTSKALKELDWSPPFTVDQGIKSTVNFYLEGDKKHDTYF